MPPVYHTEEAFSLFYIEAIKSRADVDHRDFSAMVNFHDIISQDLQLTENQAKYVVKLLRKYRSIWESTGLNITDLVDRPRWGKEFRKVDLTKEIFVEVDEDNAPWICLKFPYTLKKHFEEEILQVNEGFFGNFFDSQYWDKNRKIRKLNLYGYNLLQIQEFVQKHGFVIDESFVEAVNLIDDIWLHSSDITKRSKITDSKVELINADGNSEEFFQKNQKNVINDLLLAKSMGFFLEHPSTNLIEKIAASEENWFWCRDFRNLMVSLLDVEGKIVFLLDRSSDYLKWVKDFKATIDNNGISCKTKVCFRENNKENSGFNQWISENELGGQVDQGKFLIFLQKPNKWLFKNIKDVKVVVTNSIYPPADQVARFFLQSHPCVIFVGDVKPTDPRERKIVNL